MECKKCGSTNIEARKDSRGVYHGYCKDCDAHIKVLTGDEAKELLAEVVETPPVVQDNRPKCKYCTEHYFIRYGRLGTIYKPVNQNYCPMCGRKILPEDRAY